MQDNDDLINEEVFQFVPRAAPVKHSMLRRNRDWHYCWAGVYMITLVLADRSHPILGRLHGDGDGAFIELSPMGLEVAKCWSLIKDFNPNLEPLDYVVMPDHFHGILRVKRRLERPMGEAIRGFKIGCTKAYRTIYGAVQEERHPVPAHKCAGLWASGYQDSIAFNEQRLACMIAYIKDNPRRLAVKRANRELFKVVNRLPFGDGAFMALGNRFLLDAPLFYQIQCSRSITPTELAKKKDDCRAAIERGAVIVSPCISPGEREIAKDVFEAKGRLIALKNKGFAPLYKTCR